MKENNIREELTEQSVKEQPMILKVISIFVVPFIIIFGIYIVFNGHLSPGGGFSGGAIIGAGLSLYASVFGAEKIRRFFTFKTFTVCTGVALAFYALAKGIVFFTKESLLPVNMNGNLFSSGLILPLNICVGIVVACTIYGLYALFSEGEV
mgnify:CR=1 FL=1